ncbi:MAG: hypothetical protein CM15mP129_03720 [Chloroflexota bacterium]|nr:MAG: hypothetical protein CM15mP129_03720 [Chloroflexota bacterium]
MKVDIANKKLQKMKITPSKSSILFHCQLIFNHPSAAVEGTFDWIIVYISEIFVSQKMMGLFSVVFGAGIVIFIDLANKKNYKRPRLLSIWRNSYFYCSVFFMHFYGTRYIKDLWIIKK